MDWPSCTASRSNTTRGTTSVALPAPNGIVALISRDGQVSALAVPTAKTLASTHVNLNRLAKLEPKRLELESLELENLELENLGIDTPDVDVAEAMQESFRWLFRVSP